MSAAAVAGHLEVLRWAPQQGMRLDLCQYCNFVQVSPPLFFCTSPTKQICEAGQDINSVHAFQRHGARQPPLVCQDHCGACLWHHQQWLAADGCDTQTRTMTGCIRHSL